MAVDTVAKRKSMLGFGETDVLLPKPDGTLSAKDRLHLLGLYGGIADAEASYYWNFYQE